MDSLEKYISINPAIRFGKPCIAGTRIALSDIYQWLASGMSESDILKDYPQLTKKHLQAALYFAANREESIRIVALRDETTA